MLIRRTRSMIIPAMLVLFACGCESKKQHTIADGSMEMARNTTYDLNGESARNDTPTSNPVWTCPMHPRVRQSLPGTCSVCGMELVQIGNPSGGGGAAPHAGHSNSSHSSGSHEGGSCCH
jgi:hypothetical protein